jgi:hypothetical protein
MKQYVLRTHSKNTWRSPKYAILVFASLLHSGCWLMAPSPTNSSMENPGTAEVAASVKDALEIFWRIPDVEIDGFVLSYGITQDKLTQRVRIEKGELLVVNDEIWGPVFRYLLKDVPNDQTIFFTLESFKGDQYSAPSVVQRVEGK